MYETWDYRGVEPESALSLMQRELPPNPCWIEPGVLPKRGKLFYGGESGIGKSILMLSLIRGLIYGKSPFNATKLIIPQPVNVLYIEQELGPWLLQSHCRKIFSGDTAEPLAERFRFLSQVRKLRLDDPDCVPAITDWCLKTSTNVLCLDPISKMHSANENSSTEVGKVIERLERILDNCKETDLSIVYTHHFGKPARDSRYDYDPYDVNNFRGSTSFRNDADTIITVRHLGRLASVTTHKAWVLGTGWVKTRAAESPYETGQEFVVNREGNLRVEIGSPPRSDAKPDAAWSPGRMLTGI